MADQQASVRPTPIQRNALDVATELTQLYFKSFGVNNKEEISDVFLHFYATAEGANRTHHSLLSGYVSDKFKTIINK